MNGILKLTVITVVYNAADRLKDTIESVVGQDYDGIEYIIKDGGSTDGTVGVIKEYADRYGFIKYSSGRDSGIYDAMNSAVKMATGDVIEFLNAGDRFATDRVVSETMRIMADTDSDIVYGDILYENPDGTTDVRSYPKSCSKRVYYLTGDVINHQAVFARRCLFDPKQGGSLFDTSLSICADREWMLKVKAYRPYRKMTSLGFVVVIYPLDGVSVINSSRYKKEADICIRRHIPLGYPVYAAFEFFRAHKTLAGMLHRIYQYLYIRKPGQR